MSNTILPAKLHIPPPHPDLIVRSRLVSRLDAGLKAGHRMSVIVAPAGSGKTTLVTTWVYSAQGAVATYGIAWLSLDAEDNDPARLLLHLIAALQQIDPRVGRGIQDLLTAPRHPPTEELMTGLIGDIARTDMPFLLVLDDYHEIKLAEIHKALSILLERQPQVLHLVLITREDPPLPLVRIRVQGGLTEIRDPDLRFTPAEIAIFLAPSLDRTLPQEQIAAVAIQTEGWAAALQLLKLALPDGSLPASAQWVAGDSLLHIGEYVVSEVLARQPTSLQDFLRSTAILQRLTPALCDAMTGRTDSSDALRRLVAANLFTTRLVERGEWYRYHTLFADALRSTLDPATQATLHRRALAWYRDAGLTASAMYHALALKEITGDFTDIKNLIKLNAEATAWHGEVLTVQGWLDILPDTDIRRDGELATLKGWILAISGLLPQAVSYAEAAEMAFRSACISPTTPALGKLRCLRSFIAVLLEHTYDKAIALADDALTRLSVRDPADADRLDNEIITQWRILALWSKAEALERQNEISAAISALQAAQRLGRSQQRSLFGIVAEAGLIKLLNDRGQRRDALAACEDALRHYADDQGPLPLASFIYGQMGGLHLEGHDLTKARHCHEQAADLSRQLGLSYEGIYMRALAAPTLYAIGETDAALTALREGYQHASQKGYADAAWFLAWETRIRLEQGDLVFGRHWAHEAGLTPQTTPSLLQIESHLVYARLLILQRRTSDVREWLARLEAFTRAHGLYRWLITTLLLQTIIAYWSGDRASARDLLEQAVRTAVPEGYVHAFLTEGPRILSLLPEVRAVAPAFVDQLLRAAEDAGTGSGAVSWSAPDVQIETLTHREQEVLRLIIEGRSNQEIADKLVVALSTVKRHINNLYAKLQVSRRTEAVARARELGIM